MSIYVKESYTALSEGRQVFYGDSGFHESIYDNRGDLFRACQKEHGRCVSYMYHDDVGQPIGWVFQKSAKYEDTGEPYVSEVWVELHKSEPTHTVEYHYLEWK